MASVSYVRITTASGVLMGDNGSTWTPVDDVSFGTSASTSTGVVVKPTTSDLTFALTQSSSLSPQLKKALTSHSAIQVEVATYDPSTATASSVGTLQSYDVFGGTGGKSLGIVQTETLQNGDADVYTVATTQVSQSAYANGQQISASGYNTANRLPVSYLPTTPAAVVSGAIGPADPAATNLASLSYYMAFEKDAGSYSITSPTLAASTTGAWIPILDPSSALEQVVNLGSTGVGQVSFDPLSVTLLGHDLDTTLAQAVDLGTIYPYVQIEAVRSGGTVVGNTTLGTVVASSFNEINGATTLVLNYGSFFDQHVATPSLDPIGLSPSGLFTTTSYGWNAATKSAVTSGLPIVSKLGYGGANGTTQSNYFAYAVPSKGTLTGDTSVQLTSSSLPLVAGQTSYSAFAPTNVAFGQSKPLTTTSSSTGAGKVSFSPVSFDLTADAASAAFDSDLFSNTPIKQLILGTYRSTPQSNVYDIPERVTLSLVGVQSDALDLLQGTHSLQFVYGAQQITTAAYTPSGSITGTPISGGWDQVKNLPNSATTSLSAVQSLAVATPAASAVPVAATVSAAAVTTASATAATAQATPTQGTAAYVQFRNAAGGIITDGPNGSSWFALSAASTGFSQTINLTSGATRTGNVSFSALALGLGPDAVTAVLDKTLGSGSGITAEVASYNGNTLLNDYVFGGATLTSDAPSSTGSSLTFQYTGYQATAYTAGVASTPVTWNSATNSTAFSASTAAPVSAVPPAIQTPTQLVTYAEFVGANGALLSGTNGKTLFATSNVSEGLAAAPGTKTPTVAPLSLSLGDDGIVSTLENGLGSTAAPLGVVLVSYDASNPSHLVSYQTFGDVYLSGATLDQAGGDNRLTFNADPATNVAYSNRIAPISYTEQMPDDFSRDGSSGYSTVSGLPNIGSFGTAVPSGQVSPYQSFTPGSGESFTAEVLANGTVDVTDPVSNSLLAASNVALDYAAKTGSFSIAASALPGLTQALTAGKPVTIALENVVGQNQITQTFGGSGTAGTATLTGAKLDAATGLADVTFSYTGTPGISGIYGQSSFAGDEIYPDEMTVTPQSVTAAGSASFVLSFTNHLAPIDGLVPADLTVSAGADSTVTGSVSSVVAQLDGTYVATVTGLSGSGTFTIDATSDFKNNGVEGYTMGSAPLVTKTISDTLATNEDGSQSITVPALDPKSGIVSVTQTYDSAGTLTLTATAYSNGTSVTVAPGTAGDPAGAGGSITATYASASATTPLHTVYENAAGSPVERVDVLATGIKTTVYAADGSTTQSVTTLNNDGSKEVYQLLATGPFASSDDLYDTAGDLTQATYARANGIKAEVDSFGSDGSKTVAIFDTTGAPLETTVTNPDGTSTVTQNEAAGPYATVTTSYDASGKATGQTEVARTPNVTLDNTGGALTTPNLAVTGSIDIPGVVGTVQLIVNGTASGDPVPLASDGSFAADLPLAANGVFDVAATVTTAAGGVGTSGSVEYTVTDIAPSVAITSTPTAGTSAGQTVTGVATPSGTAAVAGQAVTLTDNGVALATAEPVTVGTDGSFSADVVLPYEGANAIVASVVDSYGNIGSAAVTETLDQVAPVVASPTLAVAAGSGPTAVGIAAPSDDVTPVAGLAITATALPNDGTLTLADGITAVTAGMSLTAAELGGLLFTPGAGVADQSSAFVYTVADGVGNTSTGTATLTVGDPAPAPSPFASTSTRQNPDGSISTTYAGGPYFDGKRYSALTETTAPDGTLLTQTFARNSGGHLVGIETSGQTVSSSYYDTFVVDVADGAAGHNTFVFDPGFGQDVVHYFTAAGQNHDTLSLASSDFTGLADVLRHTADGQHGVTITDPTSHDQIHLLGVTKAQLAANARDITFHT